MNLIINATIIAIVTSIFKSQTDNKGYKLQFKYQWLALLIIE